MHHRKKKQQQHYSVEESAAQRKNASEDIQLDEEIFGISAHLTANARKLCGDENQRLQKNKKKKQTGVFVVAVKSTFLYRSFM